MQFVHRSRTLTVTLEQYHDGNMAVLAWDGDCEPYATLSVNMPGPPPPAGVFYLKDWTENVDVARSFRESGLIERATDVPPLPSGHVVAQPWRFRTVPTSTHERSDA